MNIILVTTILAVTMQAAAQVGNTDIQKQLEDAFSDEKPEETEDFVSSWTGGDVVNTGRSGMYQPGESEGPSYAYGALALNNLIRRWMEAAEKDPDEIITDDEIGPSYAFGALSPKFKVDAIIVEAKEQEFPEPQPSIYTLDEY